MEKTEENLKWSAEQVEKLSCLRYFPVRQGGVTAVIEQLLVMLPTQSDGEWLIGWILAHEEEFPPPAKMRQILDEHRCDPADRPRPEAASADPNS